MRHIDEEFAASSMFGGLTASGAHTFARGQLTRYDVIDRIERSESALGDDAVRRTIGLF